MRTITRRSFLKGSAASILAVALGGIGVNAYAEEAEEAAAGTYEWELLSSVTVDESRTSTANSDEKLDYITIGLGTVPSSMDPYSFNKSSEITVEVFETLVVATDDGDFVGIIAKDWAYTDDTETELVMNIYEGVTDSDGNEITAEDVVFSFQTYIDSGNARDFDDYDYSEATDTYQVTFHFKQKLSSLDGFDNIFASTYIVSQATYESHNFNVDPVGSGPYKITSYEEGATCILEARDDYWQSEENLYQSQKSNVQTIEYQFILDDSMRLIALESGTIAYCAIDDTSLSLFEEGGDYAGQFNIYCYEDAQAQTILPNMSSNSLMSDINMRLAVYYALDSESFADALGSRVYYPCTVDCAPVVGDYQSDWDTWETYNTVYDLELSTQYLAESGYNGETLKIITEDNSEKNTIAEVVQAYLEIAGIKSEIVTLDHALIENTAGDATQWDILIYSSADKDYAISRFMKTYAIAHGYADGYNLSFYENDEFQEMLSTVFNVDTYSEEGTNEIMQYIYDNALGYAGCYAIKVGVYSPVMAQFYTVSGTSNFVIGACEYYLD
ncbi:MAG: ABC transporter substrate-binding protein [Lachnospiraceae bacterium]|nr:ABC transporter substrate-binding protein [Lachnospiraceae bacterium]